MSEANRELVIAYYKALWGGGSDDSLGRFLAPGHTEHQYTAGFTHRGLTDYVQRRLSAYPDHRVILHHVLSENSLVFLFVQESVGGNVDYARAEMFRLQDGLLVEHWNSCVLDEKSRKNSNQTFGGTPVNRAKDYSRRFGAMFEALDKRGFDGQEIDVFNESRTPEYKQHSPKGGDGRAGLVEILGKAKAAGIKTSMTCYRTLCDGDFLVSHRLYDSKPTHPLMTRIYTFDMFRLNSHGKAEEHWDVMDSVPSAELLDKMI